MRQRVFITLALLWATVMGSMAQETLTVYDGTTTNNSVPFYGYYADYGTRGQFVIPTGQLTAMNGGVIETLTFYTSSDYPSVNYNAGVTVYLKEVGYTEFATAELEDWTTMTAVWTGTISVSSSKLELTLTEPYTYNGGNLMIGFQITTWGTNSPLIRWLGDSQDSYTAAYNTANSSHTWFTSITRQKFIPKTTFSYELDDPACPKPTNLTVADITAHTATVAWESDLSTFNMQYKASTTDVWTEVNALTAKSYNLTGLNPGASYNVRVQALDNSLESKWANVSFNTSASTMTAPTALSCTALTATSATLEWTKNGDETAWQICLDGDETNLVDVTENPYTFTGLTSEHTYTVRVRAVNGTGDDWSPWSDAVSFMPTNRVTIGSGSSVVYGGLPTQSGYKYTFSQQLYTPEQLGSTPCTFHSIDFFSTNSSTTPRKLDVYMVQTDQTSYVADPWRDWVPVSIDNLVFSGEVTFVGNDWTLINFDTPFIYDGTKNVCVVVHDRTGIAGYNGQYMTFKTNGNISSYGTYQSMYVAGSTDYDVNNLANISGTSRSRSNNYIRLLKGDYPNCERPATVSVGTITPYTASVTWEGSGSTWNLRYKLADADEWTTVSGLTNKTYTLTNLTPEATYYVGVQTDCGSGDLSLWRRAEFTTTEVTPTPSALECTGFTATSATFGWTENGEATTWEVCLNDDETNLIPAASNPFTVTGLTEDVIYSVKVRATNGDLHSHWTDVVKVQPTDKLCIGTESGVVKDGNSNSHLPTDFNSKYSLTQQIYTAAELGSTPCSFTSIDFYLRSDMNLKRNIDIYMVLTDKSSISSSTDWVSFSQEDLVFSGEVQTLEYAWTSITLDSPFMYDGQHNVAIIVHDKSSSAHSSNSWATYSTDNNYQELHAIDSYEFDLTALASLYGNRVYQKNQIRLGMGAYNSCLKPTDITVSNLTTTSATISWTSDAEAWDVMVDGEVVATAVTAKSYELTNQTMASVHEVQVRTNCGGGSVSPWSNAVSFVTILCDDVNKCTISYELSLNTEYYDQWFGNAILVTDVLTGEQLDSWTVTTGGTASGTLAVCEGRQIQFTWKEDDADFRCVYSVYDNIGDLIFSGSGKLTDPITYTVDCSSHLPKPIDLTCTSSIIPKATLTWTEKGTATKWEICLDGDEENLIEANVNPFTITGLTTEAVHTAKVRAVNGTELSRWSNELSFEVTRTTPIGTGTGTNNNIPFDDYYKYSLSQQIYTAAELGGEARTIETIAFRYGNNSASTARTMDIYMVLTTTEQFNNSKSWETVTAGDRVYSGQLTFNSNEWTTITLDAPFEYDGTSNLLLVVDDNTGSDQDDHSFYSYDDTNVRTIYYKSDSKNLDPTQSLSSVSGSIMTTKNQLRVLFGDPVAVPRPVSFYSPTVYSHSAWLRWVEKGNATAWQLSVNDDEENLITVTKNPYLLEGLSSETAYTIKVRSVVGNEYSAWAGPITITTDANGAPWGLGAEQIGPNSSVLSWYDDEFYTAWQICVNDDEESLIDVTENPYTLTGLTPETTYKFRVRGVIPNETCPWSGNYEFTTTVVNPVPRDIKISSAHTTATVKWLGFSDNYNVQYREAGALTPIFTDGFEDDQVGYTLTSCHESTGYYKNNNGSAHSGNYSFRFYYTETPPQYLISPSLEELIDWQTQTEELKLQFYYRNQSGSWTETFEVGFSSQTKDAADFTFGAEVTAADEQWHLYSVTIPAGTKYICIKCTSDDQLYLFIDDIVVGTAVAAGEWQTVATDVATATLTGLTAGTGYELQVQGIVDETASEWSDLEFFTTQSATTKIFFADGNWNDATKWEPAGVPTATDDVHIMAAAVIPSGYVATANSITYGGSPEPVVIKDGAQLKHNTDQLLVTMEKNVSGYGSNATGGYSLYTPPMDGTYWPSEIGMEDGTFDLYEFNTTEPLEWRNNSMDNVVLRSYYGYLYANTEDKTLSVTGLTEATQGRSVGIYYYYDDESTNSFNGWKFMGNPFVCNAYIAFGTYDDDDNFIEQEANFYKLNANGDGFTLYKNYVDVAPGEAVFVELTASGFVYFSTDPLHDDAPVAETGTFFKPFLPLHGMGAHQDADITVLENAATDNSDMLSELIDQTVNVVLANRTLYRDGYWNTLTVPFNVDLTDEACPLFGATALPLSEASITGTTLNLTFGNAVDELEAGTPYIIKWEAAATNIVNPVFTGVTISTDNNDFTNGVEGELKVRFLGTYDMKTIDTENRSILFMGDESGLYYPNGIDQTFIGACRAYFMIGEGDALARQITGFSIDFGAGNIDTGIISVESGKQNVGNGNGAWYTLDGRRLNAKPTQRGVYIHNGKKIVVK